MPDAELGYGGCMRTHDEPFDIGDLVLNVRADLISRKLMDEDGAVLDPTGLREALVSSIKKPIVIRRGEDMKAKLAEGHALLTRIVTYVVLAGDEPTRAGFRLGKLTAEPPQRVARYVIERQGDRVRVCGSPALEGERETRVFEMLARSLAEVQVFDDEQPAVASALRDLLDRR